MSVDQIENFLERLSRNQMTGEEMRALTAFDLDLVNAYLAGRLRAFKRALRGGEGVEATVLSRSYSEREVLAELGITD